MLLYVSNIFILQRTFTFIAPFHFQKTRGYYFHCTDKKSEDKSISLHFLHIAPTPKEKNSRDLEHKSFDFLLV